MSTKIGCGWKEFCSLHRLEKGDYIVFEEERDNFNKDIKVIPHNVIFFNKDKLSLKIKNK